MGLTDGDLLVRRDPDPGRVHPTSLLRVRDHDVLAALATVRAAAGERVALFNPTTGPARSLHLDSAAVVVDDAWALAGGTHLWPRGLSFDASLAVSGCP